MIHIPDVRDLKRYADGQPYDYVAVRRAFLTMQKEFVELLERLEALETP